MVAGFFLLGCAQVLGIEPERHVSISDAGPKPSSVQSSDIDSGAPVVGDGPWDCLDEPRGTPNPDETVDLSLSAYDAVKPFASGPDGGSDLVFTKYSELDNVQIRACPDPLDTECASTGSPWQTTGPDAGTNFTLSQAFPGFIQMRRDDLIPVDFYPPFVPGIPSETFAVAMMTQDAASTIGLALGVPLDLGPESGEGMLFTGAYDCNDHHAAGVAFTLSSIGPKTLIYYLKSGFPSTSATETSAGKDFGGGGAINVPAGATVVTATLVDGRRFVASVNVVVRAGGIDMLWFRPRKH